MSYKSINGLMKHLRDNGIEINGSKQKKQLRNYGYYHVYKGYRFFQQSNKKIPFSKFDEIDATIRFISAEPLLEDLGVLDLTDIHWVIVGGESGNQARPMRESWAVNIRKQCEVANVAFFFKQWGTWGADGKKRNKALNGKKLEGKIHQAYPEISLRNVGECPATAVLEQKLK